MTRNPICSEPSFREALVELVREADRNGVNVEGGWIIEDADGARSWEAEIVEIAEKRTN